MNGFTYDKNAKRWKRADGSQIRLGNRILTKTGDYVQLNSDGTTTKIGTKGKGITKEWAAEAKRRKIDSTLDNQAMMSGLINQNGRWRPDSNDKTTKIKNENGNSYFLGRDNVWRNTVNGMAYGAKPATQQQTVQDSGPESYAGKFTQWLSEKAGHKLGNKSSELLGTAAYMTPYVGNVLSAMDAYQSFKKGDIKEGLMNTLFALPLVGNVGSVLKGGLRLASIGRNAARTAKAANAIKKVDKGLKAWQPINNFGSKALKGYMMISLPKTGFQMYDSYNTVKKAKEEMKPITDMYQEFRNKGLTDQQISQGLGMDAQKLNQIKTFAENDTLGILGKSLTDDNF